MPELAGENAIAEMIPALGKQQKVTKWNWVNEQKNYGVLSIKERKRT